jgi:hypothetical protein
MAEADNKSSTTDWLLLRDAWLWVAGFCTPKMAERLILEYLRAGRLRWTFWQLRGVRHELDPHGLNPAFWDDSNAAVSLVIDWYESSATRSVTPGVLVTIPPDDDGLDAIREQHLWAEYEEQKVDLMQRLLKGQLPPTNYTMELIRLHRGDLEAMMREAGLLAPVSVELPSALPPSTTDSTKTPPVEPSELAGANLADELLHPKLELPDELSSPEPDPETVEPEQPESKLDLRSLYSKPAQLVAVKGMCKLYPPHGLTSKTHKKVAAELGTIGAKVSPGTVRRARPYTVIFAESLNQPEST